MWFHRFTNYLLRNQWQTVVLTFLITFVPGLAILGIIVAALVTLCIGVTEGLLLSIVATLPFVISFYLTVDTQVTIPLVIWVVLGVGVISNALTYVFAVMLRQQASWSVILQVAGLLGVLVVSVIHLMYPNVGDWWASQLHAYYMQAQSLANAKTGLELPPDAQLEAISITKQYATGLMTAAILLNAILQLVVARWWQAAVFNPGNLCFELQRIRLSKLAGILFIFSIILSYWGNSVVLDIMPILYTLFGVAGLSVIHYLFRYMKSKTAWFWIMLMYLILLFSLPTSLILLSIFALFDIWLDLRNRFKNLQKN